jgi:hypothetical protein
MKFTLNYSDLAKDNLKDLKKEAHLAKRYKAVIKALINLADNPKHPSLQTHPYYSVFGPSGEKVFEAYAENNTPGAYRILFYYGRVRGEIDILMITSHP